MILSMTWARTEQVLRLNRSNCSRLGSSHPITTFAGSFARSLSPKPTSEPVNPAVVLITKGLQSTALSDSGQINCLIKFSQRLGQKNPVTFDVKEMETARARVWPLPERCLQRCLDMTQVSREKTLQERFPKALLLMNSPVMASAINGDRPFTAIGKILHEQPDDREAASMLYLRTLARHPTDRELNLCLDHVKEVGNRNDAFEDIFWSLLNSTEFIHRK